MRRLFVSGLPIALVLAACSGGPPDDRGDGEARRTAQAIINGNVDTSHQAVVAIIMQQGNEGGACSGTIVKTDPARHIGWVLTAGHCVNLPPVLVIQGNDYSAPDALRFEVIDYVADSRYTKETSSPYDFAMIRIAGVDENTPTIAIATSPDGLGEGTPVTSVGYGRTTLISSGDMTPNTIRRNVDRTLAQLSSTQIAYDMSDAGICQGDSGGPVLVQASGGERIVGVHSFVEGDCNGTGVSGRAIAGASFFDTELSKALPADDCNLCEKVANSGNQECASLTRTCFSDPDCKGYYDCLSNGTAKTTCLQKFPKAEGPFTAAAGCICTRACADKCSNTLACITTPKCGYALPAGDCKTCTEGSCCNEMLDCTADGTCYLCLKTNDADPSCADNPLRKKVATCVASSCSDQCAGNSITNGADPNATDPNGTDGPGGAPKTTTTTTSGCSVGGARSGRAGGAAWAAALALACVFARRRRASVSP